MVATSSPAWVTRLLTGLDDADRSATEIAGGLTPEQLNWRPAPDVWSIGQCLDHLRVSIDVYAPPIGKALDGRDASPVADITLGWLGGWFIRNYIDPSPQTRRGRAPGKIVPTTQVDPAILDRFLESNVAARALIRRAAAYDVNRIRFVNPFVPLLRFTVGTGLELTVRHERRHLLQAQRIKESAAFPR